MAENSQCGAAKEKESSGVSKEKASSDSNSVEAALEKMDAQWTRRFEMFAAAIEQRFAKTERKRKRVSSESDSDVTSDVPKDKTKPSPSKDDDARYASEGEIQDDTVSVHPSDQEEDLIAELDKDLEGKEKTSAAVATSLAELINKKFRSKLSEEKTKDRMEKYVRPENCGALQTPLVNPEIWKSMTGEARNSDIKFSHMQKAIATAGTALAESTQTLIHAKINADAESRKKIGEAIEKNGDAIALAGSAFHSLSIRRRQGIRPFLNANLAGLCSDSVPVSDKWLFGDNLATSMKDIKEMDKLGSSLTPVAGPSGTQKAKYGGANAMTNYRYKPHFLGKKNSHWNH
ncbi:uncharacterized protein [Littorina saxatilis]|uniref:uncharacterized protein n=1 Tax=Littorina saxatilis TaxID=31220 RepID=UPI0038B42744